MRDSFVFYRSFAEACRELPPEEFKEAVLALCDYAMDDTEPEAGGIAKAILIMAKPVIDSNNQKYKNGKKGGRPKTNAEPNNNQAETKTEPNNNQAETKTEPNVTNPEPYVDVDVDVDVDEDVEVEVYGDVEEKKEGPKGPVKRKQNKREPLAPLDVSTEIITALNEAAGTHYLANSKHTRKFIAARLNDGFTVDDFKTVIEHKARDWIGTEQEKFLRPETLFGTKFEGYLNQHYTKRNDMDAFAAIAAGG